MQSVNEAQFLNITSLLVLFGFVSASGVIDMVPLTSIYASL